MRAELELQAPTRNALGENEMSEVGQLTSGSHETTEVSTGEQKNSRIRRWLKWGAASSLVAFVFLFSWYSIWKSSGSGQWEFNRAGNGVVVHTMKVPGDPLVRVKGVGRIQSSLAGIFKLMRDAESCMDAGCYDASVFKSIDYPHIVYYKFTYPLFFPFKDREYVVVSEFTQDPDTKEIRVDYLAVPDALPPDDCCVRITRMHNKWRFTPLENGEIETEFELETSSGGFFPDLIISLGAPGLVHWAIQDFQRILDQDRYKNAPAEYVLEVGQSPALTPSAYETH